MSIRIDRVYTRGGDKGETSLVGGQRVAKDDIRIEAYGTVDEMNAVIGLVRAEIADLKTSPDAVQQIDTSLLRVQHELFNLGSILATKKEDQVPQMPRVGADDVARLEAEIDAATKDLPALTSFVLPGGSKLNALLHLARTVCRRAERQVVNLRRDAGCGVEEVQYLNRLSDALFVWSRQAAATLGHDEVLWQPAKGQKI